MIVIHFVFCCFENFSALKLISEFLQYVKTGLDGFYPWHAADQAFLDGLSCVEPFDERDRAIDSFYKKFFINFAKFGNPTPEPVRGEIWEPLQAPIGFNFLAIDVQPQMKPFFNFAAVEFWSKTVPAIKKNFGDFKKNFESNFAQNLRKISEEQKKSPAVFLHVVGFVLVLCIGGIALTALVFLMKRNRILKKSGLKNRLLRDAGNKIDYESL